MLSAFTLAMISISEVKRIGKELRINEQIRAREVRVVSDANEQLGIMTLHEAIRMAEEKGLDLVEVAPNGRPPVCRIMNYGKYRYEQQKRDKEAKKKQKVFQIKEVKLRPNIEDHDFFVKLKNAQRFLGDGNKVKVTIMFRGREMTHPELGQDVLDRFAKELGDTVVREKPPKLKPVALRQNVLLKPDPVSSRETKHSRATFSKRSPRRERETSEKQHWFPSLITNV